MAKTITPINYKSSRCLRSAEVVYRIRSCSCIAET